MLQKLHIYGAHTQVDDDLKRYVRRKIGRLDRYLSRHSRQSAHAEVHLKETKKKDSHHGICEVTFYLPHETVVVKESAPNLYAAVDIAETKLKQQLQKYKDQHGSGKLHRRLWARVARTRK